VGALPGAGPALAVAIVGNTGDIWRFPSAAAYAAYYGLAPATRQRGRSPLRARADGAPTGACRRPSCTWLSANWASLPRRCQRGLSPRLLH